MRDEIIKQYPYLEESFRRKYIVSQQDYDDLDKGEQLEFHSINYQDRICKFNKDLIRKVLNDEYCFSVAVNACLPTRECEFEVKYFIHGDISGSKSIPIGTMLSYLCSLKDLTDEEKTKLNTLSSRYSVYFLLDSVKTYSIKIDGKPITVQVKDLINILYLDDAEFDKVRLSKNPLPGITTEEFSYIFNKFASLYSLRNRFSTNKGILSRIEKIIDLKEVDYEALNEINSTEDEVKDEVELNEKLVEDILSDMPDNLSEIEQTIYIYIKLCSVLSYDPEFYAMEQTGIAARKHSDITRLSTITPKNNLVVCYEFNQIFGKLLNSIGVNYHSHTMTDSYGSGHAYLKYRVGKFLMEADSVKSILAGDMVNVKIPRKLDGLQCMNTSKKTSEEFAKLSKRIYGIVVEEMESKVENVPFDTDDLIRVYQQSKKNEWIKVNLREKVNNLFTLLVESGLTGVDALGYVLHLKKQLFSPKELSDNILFRIVRHKTIDMNTDTKIKVSPVIIITINNKNYEDIDSNVYMHYEPLATFTEIDLQTLRDKFKTKEYEYFGDSTEKIPGLEGVKHVV